MRKIARVRRNDTDARWILVHASTHGIFVFPFQSDFDGSATHDRWFETLVEAEHACRTDYGIDVSDWICIADPRDGCQQDWIAPVRCRNAEAADARDRTLERWIDGRWLPIDTETPPLTVEAALSTLGSDA